MSKRHKWAILRKNTCEQYSSKILILLCDQEKQIKTTIKCHVTHILSTQIKAFTCCRVCRSRASPICCGRRMADTVNLENICNFLVKLNIQSDNSTMPLQRNLCMQRRKLTQECSQQHSSQQQNLGVLPNAHQQGEQIKKETSLQQQPIVILYSTQNAT